MSAQPDPRVLPLNAREEREAEKERAAMPGDGALLIAQTQGAVSRLYEDSRVFPQFPWPALAEIAGPMCPEDLVLVMARTGGGKSMFLTNLFDSLVCEGRCGLYVGLEQSPEILRTKWACLRANIDPRLVLATRPDEFNTPAHLEAIDAVRKGIDWQRQREVRECAHFATSRMIDPRGLRRWTEWAVDRGAQFVILDHIDRVKHGEGKNPFHEMSETMRLAKELACQHNLVMLIASQVGRPADSLEQYMPPQLHNARGGGTKEEESDTVLGIYRPLKADVDEKDMKRVRQGMMGPESIIEPHQMGVRLLKHRLDGAAYGKVAKLAVHHGRITDLPEKDLYSTQYDALRRI